MSSTASFLQRVVATVGPAGGAAAGATAEQALRPAGPLALGRFLRRRWLPMVRRAIAVARAAEDEDLEGQQAEEPASSAPQSVQTVRRAATLRRSESSSADEPAPAAASVPDPGTVPVARLARAENAARPATRRAPGEVSAPPVAPVAAPRAPGETAARPVLPAGEAQQPGVLPGHAEPAVEEQSSLPGLERVELRPETTLPRAIARLAGTALASIAQRDAEIASAATAPAQPSANGGTLASFGVAARAGTPAEPGTLVAPGEAAAAESEPLERPAAGEPTRATATAQQFRHAEPGAGPGRAHPESREAIHAAEPLVQIGSIEIVIEAAPEPKSPPSAPAAAPDFSSRFYLRGL